MTYHSSPDNLSNSQINLSVASQAELERQINIFSEASIACHLLDAMPGIVFVLNNHGQIVFFNRALRDLLGEVEEKTIVGRKPGDVMECRSAIHSELGCGSGDACSTCGALTAIMAGQKGQEDVQECLLSRQVGNEVSSLTLRVQAVPMQFHGEKFTVLSGTDVSHERRRRALEKTFFHDILNLIGTIRGFAELMELNPDADAAKLSRKIFTASQRVIDEIDAQRMLLEAERGELQINRQILCSHRQIEEVTTLYEQLAQHKSLKTECSADASTFVGDKIIIGRILGNMLKNAFEASAMDEPVTIGSSVDGAHVCFWVHNVAEIPKIHQSRIFQRDFSTKGSGRGLGTYSMKLLAGLHGAEISFTSNVEEGTTFHLLVPLEAEQTS